MNNAMLSSQFRGVGGRIYREPDVVLQDTDMEILHGSKNLEKLFGRDQLEFETTFIFLGDSDANRRMEFGLSYWCTAFNQEIKKHEYRLLYQQNAAFDLARTDDFLVVAQHKNNRLFFIVGKSGSTAESQLKWLFGFSDIHLDFTILSFQLDSYPLNFARKLILEDIGIQIQSKTR